MGIIEDIIAGAVTPASAPRLQQTAAVVPSGVESGAPPRIRMTGAARSNIGGEPISVEPVTVDGTDPYGAVPRLKPRTGFRRMGYNAAAGIAASDSMDSPIGAFADAYLGSSNAEQSQTQAERTAQIDEMNREFERQKYADSQERQNRLDAAELEVKASTAEFNRARTKSGAFGGSGVGNRKIDVVSYYDILATESQRLIDDLGLKRLDPRSPAYATAIAKKKAAMDALKAELKARMGEGDPEAASGGLSQEEAEDYAIGAGDVPLATDQGGGEGKPAQKTRGAIPDNITGDGSLHDPYRVKNTRDPTIRSKIKVGDHFIYLNPKTGKEEIRIRDR